LCRRNVKQAVSRPSLLHHPSFEASCLSLQGMAFSVAMNSKRSNAIVALLIASNFAEIKGVVLKRFDPRRLLVLSFQVWTPC
jgi:Eukaryotic membrane protein family